MTRNEAIKICVNKISSYGILYGAETLVDRYVELGVLKLEEPKSVETKIFEALDSRNWSRLALLHALDQNGLKIVEK